MKADLFLQDLSAQGQRHDLTNLFKAVRNSDDSAILPDRIDLPTTSAMGRDAWQDKSTEIFIDYIERYGSPDNRYGFKETYLNEPFLDALDLIVCSLRSIIRMKNFTGADLFVRRNADAMFHEKIASGLAWMIDPQLMLERLHSYRYQVGERETLRQTFSNMTFFFF